VCPRRLGENEDERAKLRQLLIYAPLCPAAAEVVCSIVDPYSPSGMLAELGWACPDTSPPTRHVNKRPIFRSEFSVLGRDPNLRRSSPP